MRFTTAAAVLASSAMAAPQGPVSTDYETRLVTITSCAPEITNCPANSATPTAITTSYVPLTTSTVYSTKLHTVTSCAPDVVDCPARSTVVSTETVAISTTVCPVGEETQPPAPEQPEETKPATVSSAKPVGSQPGKPSAPAETEPAKPTASKPAYTKPGQPETPETPAETQPPKPETPEETSPVTPGQPEVTKPATVSSAKPVETQPTPEQPEQPEQPESPATTNVPEAPACAPSQSVTAITKSYTTVLTSVEYSTIQVPCATGGNPGPSGSLPPAPGTPTTAANPPPAVVTPPTGGNTTTGVPPAVTAGAASLAGSAIFAAIAGVAAFVLA